jgi:large subunit ribosomal protein L17
MRHLKRNKKLGRKGDHRNAMLANMVASLIEHKRITTTLARAKAVRPVAEKLVTLGKRALAAAEAAKSAVDEKEKAAHTAENVHCRRLAAAKLRRQPRSLFAGTKKHPGKARREEWREHHDLVHILVDKIAPLFKDRTGGYTRILKLGDRRGDAGATAILEWVEIAAPAQPTPAAEGGEAKAG